ncbi:MAG: histone H1 [Terriglobia bacterium]
MAKRPRDPVQLAKQVFDIAIGEAEDTVSESKRHPSKRRAGGLKGGKARAAKLSDTKRAEIAKKAAKARWSRQQEQSQT